MRCDGKSENRPGYSKLKEKTQNNNSDNKTTTTTAEKLIRTQRQQHLLPQNVFTLHAPCNQI